jgi:predicted dehydrogenase
LARLRALMLGAGGMGGSWIRHLLPRFSDEVEVVALCEAVPQTLHDVADALRLPRSARFLRLEDAFAGTDADFAIVAIPPAHHREAVLHAVARRMHVLSEKPVADSWEAAVEVWRAVTGAGLKMSVVQNHRYTPRIMTLKKVLADGLVGRPRYAVARFAADYRERNAWGRFRHEMRHSLLVEGSSHHFDQLRNICGADCAFIAGREWSPGHPSFDGECLAQYVCEMRNGMMCSYEGSCLAAGRQNAWHQEHYRVECEDGAVSVGADQVVRVVRHTGEGRVRTDEVAPVRPEYEGHLRIIHDTLAWFHGGPAPETQLADNIRSAAMLFAAIEASEGRQTVDVRARLREAGIPA